MAERQIAGLAVSIAAFRGDRIIQLQSVEFSDPASITRMVV
jgi:hypothetical protein